MPKVKSRRLITKKDNLEEKKVLVYCRRCQKNQESKNYHGALDKDLDKNGLLSICKDCVNQIYENALLVTENNIDEAIFKVCRMLNILYSSKVVDSLKLHLAKQESQGLSKQIFGLYKSHLGRHLSLNEGISGTFEDIPNTFSKEISTDEELSIEDEETIEYFKNFWGEGLSQSDYQFLEFELSNWKQTHKCDTNAEIVLLREICYIQLDMKKARMENKDTSSLLKKLLDSMKVSALDPAKANAASSGSGKEAWGIFIKNIEETTPAEYFKDKEIFKDFDNIDIYFQNYIRRPAINFYSSTRNLELLEMKDGAGEDEILLKEEEKDEVGE